MLFRTFVLLLLFSLPGFAGRGWEACAQDARPAGPVPVRAVLADRDGDTVPDRVGERLAVGGRATVASGVLRTDVLDVFLHGGGGLRLRGGAVPTPVFAGDSLVATGVLTHEHGVATLTDVAYRVAARGTAPEARRLRVDRPLETHEGSVGVVRGQVTGRGRAEEGEYLNLLVDDSLLVAFLYATHGGGATFDGLAVGQHVAVTGIVGQYDRVPPHNTGYQIYPRAAGDVRVTGLPPSFYPRAVVAGLALLALALLWIWSLRRQVQRRVRDVQANEVRYRVLFQHAGDAVFVHALDPDATRLIEVNDVGCRLLGLPRHEIVRRPLASFVGGGEATVATFFGALEDRNETLGELTLLAGDGREVPVEVRSHRFVFEGRPVVLSIARDATERKAYEEGLIRARREAEALAHAKSAFLANMSHEIRTPLAAITGFAEILREELDGTYGEFAGLIDDSGRRLLATLNSILDLARMGAGEVRAYAAPFDAAASVASAVARLQPLARRKHLALTFEPPGEDVPVEQDPDFLERIVNNLVGNAIKFTAEGRVTVGVRSTEDAFSLVVADTGMGIDPAFMPHLFEEFKQETDGFRKRHEGTGLGLAITRRLVDLMGGSIDVESVQGEGTTFTVCLPRVLAGAAPDAAGDAPSEAPADADTGFSAVGFPLPLPVG